MAKKKSKKKKSAKKKATKKKRTVARKTKVCTETTFFKNAPKRRKKAKKAKKNPGGSVFKLGRTGYQSGIATPPPDAWL